MEERLNVYDFFLFWFYGISIFVGYLIPNPFLYVWTVLFQTIRFGISTVFFYLHTWKLKTVLFQTIQLISLWAKEDQGSMAIKGVLHIPQSSCITEASPSYCLVSYLGHLLGESCSSAETQSVYSADPADWAGLF